MTFSVAAFDKKTGAAGVATITGSMCVGAFVPHARAGVGAVATQGTFTNWLYGENALSMIDKNYSASQTVNELKMQDAGFAYRQCIVVDFAGESDGWTGEHCVDSKMMCLGNGVAVAGNMLSYNDIVPTMLHAYNECPSPELADRLIVAIEAGVSVGKDMRGNMSGALKVDYIDKAPVDLRVDFAPGAVLKSLKELLTLYREGDFREFYDGVPNRINYSKHGRK